MDASADRPEFAPPPQPGLVRGFIAAVIAHLLLLIALTWGVHWKRDAQDVAAEAELWSATPQQAAPKEVVAPPPPVQAPPAPPPPPVVKEEPRPEPKPREADINVQREKERKRLEAQRREEEEERKELQRKRAEAAKKEEAKKLEAKKQEDLKKQEAARVAAENRKKEDEKKRHDKELAAKLEKDRQATLDRLKQMAGQGPEGSRGTAAQSSGPSGNWAGRVRARVKPNIVFTDDIAGNPEAIINVRLSPDGTIVGKRVVKSSGHRGWDDAVMRALEKTEVLPRDTDGRVPTNVDLIFRPKD